jgi:hypothetical protein
MCPVCWATALASFGGLLVLAVVTTVGSDRWSLMLAGLLGGASLLHQSALAAIAWWCFAALIATLAARIGYLLIRNREQLMAYRVWNHACRIARARCPVKSTGQNFETVEP